MSAGDLLMHIDTQKGSRDGRVYVMGNNTYQSVEMVRVNSRPVALPLGQASLGRRIGVAGRGRVAGPGSRGVDGIAWIVDRRTHIGRPGRESRKHCSAPSRPARERRCLPRPSSKSVSPCHDSPRAWTTGRPAPPCPTSRRGYTIHAINLFTVTSIDKPPWRKEQDHKRKQ